MQIKLIVVGKTKNKELISLIEKYVKRINFFNNFKIIEINSSKTKKNNAIEIKKIESENILKNIITTIDNHYNAYVLKDYSVLV